MEFTTNLDSGARPWSGAAAQVESKPVDAPAATSRAFMNHASHPLYAFHVMNTHLRQQSRQLATVFVKSNSLTKDLQASDDLGELSPAQVHQLEREVLRMARSFPNTAAFMKAKRQELHAMQEQMTWFEALPPTMFATQSYADTHDPNLTRLLAEWSGTNGTSRDPRSDECRVQDKYRAQIELLKQGSAVAVSFFHWKTRLFLRDIAEPILGFTDFWSRYEYQARTSIHVHKFLHHPGAPNLGFLDDIASGIIDNLGPEEQDIDGAEIAKRVTDAARVDSRARCAAAWYTDMLDNTNRYYDSSLSNVLPRADRYTKEDGYQKGQRPRHPSSVDPYLEYPGLRHGHTRDGTAAWIGEEDEQGQRNFTSANMTPARVQAAERDYQRLRADVGRHDVCSPYCQRKDPKTGKMFCRFAQGLEEKEPNETHFFAEVIGDGSALRWKLYLERVAIPGEQESADPRMNTTMVSWGRSRHGGLRPPLTRHLTLQPLQAICFRANTDCRPVIDKVGASMYATKAANYASKPETQTSAFKGVLSTHVKAMKPGAKLAQPFQKTLYSSISRDIGGMEVDQINLKIPTILCSRSFVHKSLDVDGSRRAVKIGGDQSAAGDEEEEPQEPKTVLEETPLDVYFGRLLIHQRMADAAAGNVDEEEQAKLKERRLALTAVGFKEFYIKYQVRFTKGKVTEEQERDRWGRYKLELSVDSQSLDLRKRKWPIVVIHPALPRSMRKEEDPEHDLYCRHRLLTYKPFASREDFYAYVGWRSGGVASPRSLGP